MHENTQQFSSGHFGFSGARIATLGANEYTVVGVALDRSGSVHDFKDGIEAAMTRIVQACQDSPRADNLLLRVTTFDREIIEVHGFRKLADCPPASYGGVLGDCNGVCTSLFDAAENTTRAVLGYGEQLTQSDFTANGILFVVTDGLDNNSAATPKSVRNALAEAVKGEKLESLVSVLIGVNLVDQSVQRLLEEFAKEAGFTQFAALDSANTKTLTRLAEFVSKSISAQSQALGTKGPSQPIAI